MANSAFGTGSASVAAHVADGIHTAYVSAYNGTDKEVNLGDVGGVPTIRFASGVGTFDTNLYRSAANTLKTDDSLVVAGGVVNAANAVLAGDGAGNIYLQHTSGNNGMVTIESAAAGAKITFYSEAASGDTNLYRSAANRLTTDDAFQTAGKIHPGTDAGATQTATGIYAGTGAPNNANGINGDFYFRADGSAGSVVYHKEGGSWVARA